MQRLEEVTFSPELEKAISEYPNVKESGAQAGYGIDFRTLLREQPESILANSRNELTVDISPYDRIEIRDRLPSLTDIFEMSSLFESGFVSFHLYTKRESVDGNIVRHPDMFAGKFINLAFHYFSQEHNVRFLSGIWNKGSINHNQYAANLTRHGLPKFEAASQTWTGKQFTTLGFSKVDLVEESFNEGLRVLFKKS